MTFEEYIKKIEADYRRGNATEYTYRGALELMVESYGKGVDASNDPKHIECGAPDFIVEKGKVPLGYIETKDVGADLDKVEKSEQMKRYLPALHNLILTDYVEFRWYVNGERKLVFRTADFGKNSKLLVNPEAGKTISKLFTDFLATETPTVGTPKELAQRLAGVTHFIRDQIGNALESGDPGLQKVLEKQYKIFVDLLLPALSKREFADLYAQAITYGLFAAKLSAPEGAPFEFEDAYKYLRSNPFLRKLFQEVNDELEGLDIIQPYLKDLVSLLNRAHFDVILAEFGKRTRTEDPVVHFYETFLATYDPKMRESRGVYYTPEPVVQFIVRSVDEILKTRFNKPWGLADESVKVLDPATGTGTFLYYVIQQIHNEIVNERGQGGQWAQKSKSMLKRLYGFELLIAPYVVSHLKLGLLMQSLGAPLEGKDERLRIYLTNALEEGVTGTEMFAGMGLNIAEESSEAAKVKNADDIMVVLGNPPYSNFGQMNKGKWITELLDDYKKGLKEKKLNLDDDFIKFIRFAQWRISKTGKGIVGFITNNSYIDGLTHRQMRKSLLQTFDEVFIFDLHGSTRKNETTPDGNKDENVFDIQQGVSIFLAIKNLEPQDKLIKVHHASIWGLRSDKYSFLQKNCLSNVVWNEIYPKEPDFFFVPHDAINEDEYKNGVSIKTIFEYSNSALQTKKDALTIHFTKFELEKVLNDIRTTEVETLRNSYKLGPDGRDWTIKLAKKDVIESKGQICKLQYKPFDIRWTFFTGKTKGFIAYPRADLTRQMLKPNIALASVRQIAGVEETCEVFVSNFTMTDRSMFSTNGTPYLFPLYIYPLNYDNTATLFDKSDTTRKPNLAPAFLKDCSAKLGLTFLPDGQGDLKTTYGPEDVFYYAYAVFHSPTYRSRYAEFLKIDFPRLPLTSDKKLFAALVVKGKELVELHLLKSARVEDFVTTYPVAGENRVEKVGYSGGSVWINPTQYFGKVPEEVWHFKIGGYQVCDKWLKDRKGRVLSGEEISHYQRVVVSLKETIRLMAEIDVLIPRWPMG